ncbi:MAG: hypothetical protein ACUVUD_04710 [bacterium]
MSSRGTLRAIFIVVILTALAVLYLYQHWGSVQLTRTEVRLEQERRLLEEQVEGLEVELVKLQSFCRIDSIYHACGVVQAEEFIEGEKQESQDRLQIVVAKVRSSDNSR